jgi:hypothetical protein
MLPLLGAKGGCNQRVRAVLDTRGEWARTGADAKKGHLAGGHVEGSALAEAVVGTARTTASARQSYGIEQGRRWRLGRKDGADRPGPHDGETGLGWRGSHYQVG